MKRFFLIFLLGIVFVNNSFCVDIQKMSCCEFNLLCNNFVYAVNIGGDSINGVLDEYDINNVNEYTDLLFGILGWPCYRSFSEEQLKVAVEKLVDLGADISSVRDYCTPLGMAYDYKYYSIAYYLAKLGATN